MNQGINLYRSNDESPKTGFPVQGVFLSHRRADKPLVRLIAALMTALDIHYWFDEEDQDIQRAAALGMLGDRGLVHAIERGIMHSKAILGLLSAQTAGSWWVPYEIGFSRSQGVASAFLITDQVDVLNQLPQYATISSLYASIDELARWTATLAGKDLHTDLTGIPPGVLEQLAKFVPMDPPRPDLSVLCERALNAIALLDNVETHRVLALTTQSFEWLPTTGGPISELAYDLLAPLAYFKLGLTTLPGQRSHLQLVYELPTLHYRIAAQEPEVPYAPEVLGWKSLRYRTPETTWLQGLTKEQLDERIVNFLCTRTRAGDLRLATRAEFKAEFQRIVTSNVERSRRSLGVLINPLLGFTPMTRPVYWRILAIQHQLYSDMLGRNIPGLFSRETANAAQSFLVGHPFLST